MKKIFLFLTLFICLKSFGQGFPGVQGMASPTTRLEVKGGLDAQKGLINGVYTDTTAANAGYIDFYPGSQIYTSSDGYLWKRNSTATAWQRIAMYTDIAGSVGFEQTIINNNLLTANRTVNLNTKRLSFATGANYLDIADYLEAYYYDGTKEGYFTVGAGSVSAYTNGAGNNVYWSLNSTSTAHTWQVGSSLVKRGWIDSKQETNNTGIGQTSYSYSHLEKWSGSEPFVSSKWEHDSLGFTIVTSPVVGTPSTMYKGLRIDGAHQIRIDSMATGGVSDDSVVVITSAGYLKKRDAAGFGGGGSSGINPGNIGDIAAYSATNTIDNLVPMRWDDDGTNAFISIGNSSTNIVRLGTRLSGSYYAMITMGDVTPSFSNYQFLLGSSGETIFNTANSHMDFRYQNTNLARFHGGGGFSWGLDNYITDPGANNGIFQGKLGVGINGTPSEALHVSGNIRFSGALMPNNDPGSAGKVLTSAGAGAPPTWETPTGGGGGFTTADNGLTANTATNVQLGGTLTQNTTIATTSSYGLTVSGDVPASSSAATLIATNNNNQGTAISATTTGSSGIGITASSQYATGVYASTVDGTGVSALATGTGVALQAQTQAGTVAAIFQTLASSTNTVIPIIEAKRTSSGSVGAGVGGSFDFKMQTSTSEAISNQIISKFTTVTHASRVSQLELWGVNAGTLARKAALAGSGKWTWDTYGAGTHTGTPTYYLAADASGNIIETTGTGKPTLSKSITVESPSASENISMFYTPVAITITSVADVATGSSPSFTYDIHHATDRSSGSPNELFGTNRALTSTTGSTTTSFNDATIPAGSWVWIISSAISGTVTTAAVTLIYTED